MNRFVILRHQTPAGEHWDVLLETEPALAAWSVPPQNTGGLAFSCPAKKLPDHRKFYLDYEGAVSGDRGTVSRIDSGTYEEAAPHQFRLNGGVFSGVLCIEIEEDSGVSDTGGKDSGFRMIFLPV
ncbi:MAG: hypothetical protein LBH00_06405 [Planctomycetaceae bacterium]|jgi:hypothetical protein|nr:hypothetical protein [Planctomycetaceae bacterium]